MQTPSCPNELHEFDVKQLSHQVSVGFDGPSATTCCKYCGSGDPGNAVFANPTKNAYLLVFLKCSLVLHLNGLSCLLDVCFALVLQDVVLVNSVISGRTISFNTINIIRTWIVKHWWIVLSTVCRSLPPKFN